MWRKTAIHLAIWSAIIYCPKALADPPALDKLDASAQQAFAQGKFKKAESSWTKAIKVLEENGQKNTFFEICLKRLGQTYKRLERSVEAYQTLMRAWELCNALGIQDNELAQELADVSTTYRPVDLSELGLDAATALKKANVSSVGLIKTTAGNKLQIDLPDRFEKQLDNESVDGIALEKQVTLDLDEDSDGTVTLKNIKGFKIHAKEKNMWVNLLQTIIKPADRQGQHPAEVTAGKMGVTKTVAASLPANGFEPLNGLLKQARSMVTPLIVKFSAAYAGQPASAATLAPGTTNDGSGRAATTNAQASNVPALAPSSSKQEPKAAGQDAPSSLDSRGPTKDAAASPDSQGPAEDAAAKTSPSSAGQEPPAPCGADAGKVGDR